jgi:hypothetical protein
MRLLHMVATPGAFTFVTLNARIAMPLCDVRMSDGVHVSAWQEIPLSCC